MKPAFLLLGATLALAILASGASAQASAYCTNWLCDNSFENIPCTASEWCELKVGDKFPSGRNFCWEVIQNNIDINNNAYFQPSDGAKSLDLNGCSNGGVKSKNLIFAKDSYRLTVRYAANPYGIPEVYQDTKTAQIRVVSSSDTVLASKDISFNASEEGTSGTSMGFKTATLDFTLSARVTGRVEIVSTIAHFPKECQGIVIDDVVLKPTSC